MSPSRQVTEPRAARLEDGSSPSHCTDVECLGGWRIAGKRHASEGGPYDRLRGSGDVNAAGDGVYFYPTGRIADVRAQGVLVLLFQNHWNAGTDITGS